MAKTRRSGKAENRGWPKRGEIYLAALDQRVGRSDPKTGPVLVIQNDTSNRYSAVTLVAPITTTVRLPLSPVHVLLPADVSTGLAVASAAVFNQIRTVERSRLVRKLGEVDEGVLAQVEDAIRTAFGLPEGEGRTITRAISEGTGEFRMGRYEG